MAGVPNRSLFYRRVLRFSLAGQVPPAWLAWRVLEAAGVPWSGLVLLVLLVWLNAGMFKYLRHAFPETPMSDGWRNFAVIPFFIWYFACALVLIPAVLLAFSHGLVWLSTSGDARALWSARLDLAGAIMFGAALLTSFYAVMVRRRWVKITRLEVPVEGLPAPFDGYRIAQLSDLHVGTFATGRWLKRWVEKANRLEPDLVAVTGDLLNSGDHFVPEVAEGLSGLSSRDGVIVTMGNHDYWTSDERMAGALRRAGLEVMQNEGRPLSRGGMSIYLSAVDDTWTRRADLEQALSRRPAGMPTLLLSHDPLMFPAAARRGVALTLSGHTHGGQLALPFFDRWNLSMRVYPYTSGLYRLGASTLFVHRGLGTTGPPVRLGAAPEIVLVTLRRA